MELVTGYRGMNHVTAEQLADLQAGVLGYDSCVLNIGEKLRADVVTSNKIRIFDGVFIFNGKQAMIEAGDYEDITIENGTIGLYRNDIIVVDYKKDEATGIENTTLKVLKGNTAEKATDPVYTTNDIRTGAFESEIPLYRVRLNGLAIEKVEPLYTVAENLASLNTSLANGIAELNDNLVEAKNNLSEYIVHGGVLKAVVRDGSYIYSDIPSISGYSILAKMHKLVGDHNNTYIAFVLSANDNRIWVRNMSNTFENGKTYNIMYMALYHKN